VRGSRSANPLGHRCIVQAAEQLAYLAQRPTFALPNHPDRHVLGLQAPLVRRNQALPILPRISLPLFSIFSPDQPKLPHKGFIAQNRLPAHCLKGILNFSQQALIDKTPVTQTLRSPWPAQLAQHRRLLPEGQRRAQAGITAITAPFERAQPESLAVRH
jgi:hypothetical protein